MYISSAKVNRQNQCSHSTESYLLTSSGLLAENSGNRYMR